MLQSPSTIILEPKKLKSVTVSILENPVVSKEIKPVNSKKINPKYSLEGLMLKLQYFAHLMQRTDSLEKTLMLERMKAGGEGDDRG